MVSFASRFQLVPFIPLVSLPSGFTAIAAGSRLENGQMTTYKYISRLPFCCFSKKAEKRQKTAKRQKIAKIAKRQADQKKIIL